MLASYEKIGLRRVAKADRDKSLEDSFYLDLTNLWQTKTRNQEHQYQAIKDSGVFSQQRSQTFMRFNYRYTETGTFNYRQAFKKVERGKTIGSTRSNTCLKGKGTMHVTDLWGDPLMQQVLGAPSFPRDRLKILKIWAGKGAPRKVKVASSVRIQT
jgi:hypothetical protein